MFGLLNCAGVALRSVVVVSAETMVDEHPMDTWTPLDTGHTDGAARPRRRAWPGLLDGFGFLGRMCGYVAGWFWER